MSLADKPAPVALVVDDDEMTRMLVREALEADGLRVEEARSGDEGLAAYQRCHPDIVLLDVNMPDVDGFECCRRLRAMPGGERVPVMILTGQDDEDSIAQAYEIGATDFMPKPIQLMILAHRVRYLLRASRSLEQLARSEASLAHAQELARVGNWEWHCESSDAIWSGEVYRILGLDAERDAANLQTFLRVIPREEQPSVIAAFVALLKQGGRHTLEHRIVRNDGNERIVCHQAEGVRDAEGRTLWLRGTLQDITERKQIERHIRTLAYYDSLTDLPNRVHFKENLARVLRKAGREQGRLAVLFLDLDRFKQINDTLGHQAGDQLLKEAAARLGSCLRAGDEIGRNVEDDSIARLGGDEFTVLLAGLRRVEDAAKVAQRIVAELARPFTIAGHELFVTASIGIALYSADGADVDMLLKNADAAMYCAKDAGRNNYKFYSSELNARAMERLALERDLRRALEREEFVLHYQPKIALETRRIVGVEALIRWQSPERGLVAPGQFIPLLEETGLILQVGSWALRRASLDHRGWMEQGLKPPRVAVNVSPLQARQRDFVRIVEEAIIDGVAPTGIDLEITENLVMEDVQGNIDKLNAVRKLGVKIAIDDFGTGYSSLGYLRKLPVDSLKIDRSFIATMHNEPDAMTLVSTIISLAHSLRLKVVAEGVETEEQAKYLRLVRCDEMQGYLFSKPLPAEQLVALLRSQAQLPALACIPAGGANGEPRRLKRVG